MPKLGFFALALLVWPKGAQSFAPPPSTPIASILRLNADRSRLEERKSPLSADAKNELDHAIRFGMGLVGCWLLGTQVGFAAMTGATEFEQQHQHHTIPVAGSVVTASSNLLLADESSFFGISKPSLFESPSSSSSSSGPLSDKDRQRLLKEEIKRQKEEEKAARLRAYDEMFEQDARETDKYYGDMLVKSRQKAQELYQEEKDSVGKGIMSNLPSDVATDRTGILPDALMSLQQKDQVNRVDLTMAPKSYKTPTVDIDIQLSQLRSKDNPELEASLDEIRRIREEDKAKVRGLAEENLDNQQEAIEKNAAANEEAKETARSKQLARIEELRYEKQQEKFERDMDYLDWLDKKAEQKRAMQEKAKIKFGVTSSP